MNTIGYFEIHSSYPEREIAFYTNIFGWKFSREEMPLEYYSIQNAGINGGLLKRPEGFTSERKNKNAFVCSIEVSSFDKSSELILNNGGRTELPKFAVPGKCWQGYFSDLDGNGFGIFEVDANAR